MHTNMFTVKFFKVFTHMHTSHMRISEAQIRTWPTQRHTSQECTNISHLSSTVTHYHPWITGSKD